MNIIEKYNDEQRPKILSLIEKHKSGREIYVFKSRKEVDKYLENKGNENK